MTKLLALLLTLAVWCGSASAQMSGGGGGSGATGISLSGSIGATSGIVIPAGAFTTWFTIQNTHGTQTLDLSFNATATTSDLRLGPGGSITIPYGAANALNGIGSGAGTTWAAIGF